MGMKEGTDRSMVEHWLEAKDHCGKRLNWSIGWKRTYPFGVFTIRREDALPKEASESQLPVLAAMEILEPAHQDELDDFRITGDNLEKQFRSKLENRW